MTVYTDEVSISVPTYVVDIDSFRRWAHSPDFPERGNIWWLCGEVWADMSKEQIFSHVAVKGEIFAVLHGLVKPGRLGLMLTDGVLLSNFAADISGSPDGLFLSRETLNSDRIRLLEGARGGYTELQGSPDMVLEVVSDGSVSKDLKTLRKAYWKAGVTEYWVVDARKGKVRFDIFVRGPKGFRRTPAVGGWLESGVFGKAFQLRGDEDAAGRPDYTLDVR
ncbi:MAG: Uma2 family endonuclease [Zavarzinella sp.]|nr:Uma2 family endonuclease [Zavarzinella sp.]